VTYRLVYAHRAAGTSRLSIRRPKSASEPSLVRYKEDPLRHAERLIHGSLGSFRFRIGDYRVVFDLEGEEVVVPEWGIGGRSICGNLPSEAT